MNNNIQEENQLIIQNIQQKYSEFQQLQDNSTQKQFFIGIAGIPGGGKSTLASQIGNQIGSNICKIIPMDGYHLYLKRGAPDTFNSKKFKLDVQKLKKEKKGSFPSFDHAVKDPVEDDIQVNECDKIIIIEGLYLFLKDWDMLDLFDLKIFIKCNQDEADQRVAHRNFKAGISPTLEESIDRTKKSDRLNAQYILQNSILNDNIQILDTSSNKS